MVLNKIHTWNPSHLIFSRVLAAGAVTSAPSSLAMHGSGGWPAISPPDCQFCGPPVSNILWKALTKVSPGNRTSVPSFSGRATTSPLLCLPATNDTITVSLVSPAHIWGGVRLVILSDYLTRRLMGTVFGVTASLFYLAGGGNIQAGRMDGFLTHGGTWLGPPGWLYLGLEISGDFLADMSGESISL